jgi:hypothetical protein
MPKRFRDHVLVNWEHELHAWSSRAVDDKIPPGISAPWIVLDAEMEFVCGCQSLEEAAAIVRALNRAIDAEWGQPVEGEDG